MKKYYFVLLVFVVFFMVCLSVLGLMYNVYEL